MTGSAWWSVCWWGAVAIAGLYFSVQLATLYWRTDTAVWLAFWVAFAACAVAALYAAYLILTLLGVESALRLVVGLPLIVGLGYFMYRTWPNT